MLVPKDMTIYHAAELKPLLLGEACESAQPELDLSGVSEIDSAGVQLLFLACREASVAGRRLRIRGCSAVVREILDLVGFPFDEQVPA